MTDDEGWDGMSDPQNPVGRPEGADERGVPPVWQPPQEWVQQPGYPPQQPGYPPQQPGYPPQQPGYPPQQWGQPAPQPPRKGLPVGAVIGIIVGGLAVFVAIAVVVALLVIPRPPSAEERGQVAADAVTGYLEALAASDAETALSYLGTPPTDTTLLTDDMLEAANERAQIADIRVNVPTGAPEYEYSADIAVEYSIGDTPVSTTFPVSNYDADAGWTITGGTTDLQFGGRYSGLDLTLNGEPVSGDSAEVFPGAYELTTTTPMFELTGDATLLVTEPFASPDLSSIQATLTEEGVGVFRQAATASVQECLASTTLAAGCGLEIPETLSDGTRIVDGTITRTLSADAQAPLAGLAPQESFGDPLFVQGDFIGGVDVTADCESNGQSYTGCSFLFLPSLGAPLVDFTTDPPTVRWD